MPLRDAPKLNLKEMDARESEIRLKVGVAGISEKDAGIVVPTAENIDEIRQGLSEVVVRPGREMI
jgi:hypothetical protein